MTRAQFLAEVEKAAERTRKRRRRPLIMAETSLDALAGARAADPMRGVRAARLVPRCGKIKTTDRRPCQSPFVRGGTRCWRHGGLRQSPGHPGNVKRLLGGTYARQEAYRLELKTLGEYWTRSSRPAIVCLLIEKALSRLGQHSDKMPDRGKLLP